MGDLRCKKCGQPLTKSHIKKEVYRHFSLEGYDASPSLCAGCNATDSVIWKLQNKKEITKEDLEILPQYLVFDPRNDNPLEASYGLKFRDIVEKIANQQKVV